MNIKQFNINTIKDKTIIMNEADFIQEIMKQANLSEDQGGQVNDIFQSTFLAGNKNKDTIVNLIAEKLGVDAAQAEQIYDIAIGLLASGVLSKIKGLFKK